MQSLFDEAEQALQPEADSGTSTFVGALAILLREGLEALLIVVAMITFLIRAERRDLLRWVHVGWVERARRRLRDLVGRRPPSSPFPAPGASSPRASAPCSPPRS